MLPARTLFAFALEREAKPFRRRCPDARIVIIGTGPIRSTNSIAKVIAAERPDAVVIAGYAGALVADVYVSDIIIATEVVDANSNVRILSLLSQLWVRGAGGEEYFLSTDAGNSQKTLTPNPSPAKPGEGDRTTPANNNRDELRQLRVIQGRICSAERIIGSPNEKRPLAQRFQAVAVDMESAAVARVCAASDIPWAAVRVISDAVDTNLSPELIDLISGGSVSIRRTLVGVLRKPSLLREYRRLARDTRIAAAKLAEYLDAISH